MKIIITENRLKELVEKILGYDLTKNIEIITSWYELDSGGQRLFTDGKEEFNLYVKIGEQTICHRNFDGKLFPPKVRYTVDVRPFLKDVLKELTDIFSAQKLSFDYLGFDLK